MAGKPGIDGRRRGIPWRGVGWGGAALILLLPVVTNAPWTLFDFIVMSALLGGAGLVMEMVVRASGDISYRLGAGSAVAAAFLLIWVSGAVGFLGDEDNPANLVFAVVLLTAILGSAVAGLRPAGMARAMFATATAQVAVGLLGLAAGWASPGYEGLYEVVMGTTVFASLWLASTGLFREAARRPSSAATSPKV